MLVLEAAPTIGGGTRTEELTQPGFRHDVCSAIHPLVVGSPFMRGLPLREHGLELVHPEVPLAHPLDDGSAVVLHRSVAETADGLGGDARAYRRLMGPLADAWEELVGDLLGPPFRPPRHPVPAARFGLSAAPLRDRTGAARASRASGHGRFLPATPPTRCVRSTAARPRRSGSCCSCSATASAGRQPPGARRRSPTRWRRCCGRSAARSRPTARCARSTSFAARAACSSTSRRDRSSRSPATRCPPATGGRSRATATGPACSSSTTRSTGRCPGRPRPAAAPAPCTSAARSRRSPQPSARSHVAGIRSGRSCWSRSRACSTRAAPLPERTRCGPTATCPTARTST